MGSQEQNPNPNEAAVTSEIDDMLRSFGQDIPEPEPKKEEPPKEEPPKEEPPVETPPQETEPPAGTEPPPEPKGDDKDKAIEDLKAQIAERDKKLAELATPKEPDKPKEPAPAPAVQEQDFVGEVDLDDLMTDKAQLNKLLNTVYTKGIADARQTVGEHVLREIPNIVRNNVAILQELQRASDNFFKENPDLSPFRKVVATVFEEVSAKNPNKTYGEVLTEVGKEARARLNLQKKADTKSDKGPKLPTKKGGGPRGSEQPDTQPLESEISEMNKGLGRN